MEKTKMKLFSKKVIVFNKPEKKVNELTGNDSVYNSCGMACSVYFMDKWRITPWYKFSGTWDDYEKQLDENILSFMWKGMVGKLDKLNIKKNGGN